MQGGAWRHQTTPKGNHSGSHNNDYISICCRILATAKEGRGVEVSNAFAANENPRMRHITFQIGLMGKAVFELTVADVVGAAERGRRRGARWQPLRKVPGDALEALSRWRGGSPSVPRSCPPPPGGQGQEG